MKMYGDPRDLKGSQSALCKDAADLIEGRSIIDIGCGMGHLIPYVPDPLQYVGLDSSPTMLGYLKRFFPEAKVVQADASLDSCALKALLKKNGLPMEYDTAVSISLIIHLPEDSQVKRVIGNLWALARHAFIFGAETLGDSVYQRPDGISIRNMSMKSVKEAIGYMIGSCTVQTFQQKLTYQQQIVVNPLRAYPLGFSPVKLVQRTTLFKTRGGAELLK